MTCLMLDTAINQRRALTRRVKALARGLGFDPVGVTSAEPFLDTEKAVVERIGAGLMDGLPWYNEARARRGCHPERILPAARSIIALGLDYQTPQPHVPDDGRLRGRVSRYAWSRDYHRVFESRIKELLSRLREMGGVEARFYVDYGPMPDRAIAARAGLGWHGKNSNLLTTKKGSWIFLAEVLTDLELEPDRPLKKSCGRCIACIPSCPTGAIVSPYVIDNTRCISYHTIENRGVVPRDLRPLMGDWVFGCDICQDVCPVNHQADAGGDREFEARSAEHAFPDLLRILEMTDEEFQARYRGSPIRRAKRAGLQRNACIALGNSGSPAAVAPLAGALRSTEPLVRGHAAWALGRIGGRTARRSLSEALQTENDPEVVDEIRMALKEMGPVSPAV